MQLKTFAQRQYSSNNQEITASLSKLQLPTLWLCGIFVHYSRYSAVTICGWEIFRGRRLYIILQAVSKGPGLGRQWMITVYYYVKMCLSPLVKTESRCFFPSALGL